MPPSRPITDGSGVGFKWLSTAAGAAEENYCNNDDPYPIVVEKIAKAVVHNSPSFQRRF